MPLVARTPGSLAAQPLSGLRVIPVDVLGTERRDKTRFSSLLLIVFAFDFDCVRGEIKYFLVND